MESPFDRLPTTRRILPNGLTVLVREDHSAPVVAVVTHVRAGYFDEPDAVVGISHVLEHMYFKGTERRGVGEIARETKAAGGYLNAGTIYDHTSYYTVLPASALEQALDIQADALQHSAIDEEELRRELQVIIQEAQRKLDNPEAVAQESLFETMFDVHRIRRWRIGTEPVLSRFTRADVLRYYRELYHPANTVLVIAGDVDAEHAFRLAEQYYGGMAAGEPVRDLGPVEPPHTGFRFRELDGDIMHAYLEWGWRTPGSLHADTPALDVLALVLGQGRASRLYREVREAGLVNSISAYNYTPTEVGVFGIGAELRAERADAAVQGIAGVLRGLLEHGAEAHEVERARNVLEARIVRRLETAEGQARLLAEWEALGGWELAREYVARLLSVDAAALRRVAREYLEQEAGTLLLYRPSAAPVVGPGERVRSLVAQAEARPAPPAPTWDPQRVAPAAIRRDRVEDGVIFMRTEWGGCIALLPRAGAPLTTVAVAHRGGKLDESPASAGLTTLMARASVKGTERRSAAQLAEESEALGMSIGPGAGADGFDWSITLPSRHLSHGLDLLADTVLHPRFADAEVMREREAVLSDLEQLRDDMYQYPLRLVLGGGFGAHPYGYGIDVLTPAVRTASAADVRDWHRRATLGDAPWIFAAGDIPDPEALAGEIAARFERHVSGATADPAARAAATWTETAMEVIETRRKAQTAVVLGFPGPDRNHPDLAALRVLSNAISGLGGRLFEELRSRRSLAYAVAAYPIARWQGGAFVAYIGTAPEREDEARTELLRELVRCAEERLPEDELERARRYTIGAWQIRRQTSARQLADLADAVLFGRGVADLREYEARIRAVTAEDARAAAERWLQPERLVTGVVRGGSAT